MIKGERQYILSCLFAKNYLKRWMIRNFEGGQGGGERRLGEIKACVEEKGDLVTTK